MKVLSLVQIAFNAALLCAPLCFASPQGRPAKRPSLTQNIDAREWSNVSFPITQGPPPDPFSTVPDTSPTSQCQTYGCNLFYQVRHAGPLSFSRIADDFSMCRSTTGQASRKTQRVWLHYPAPSLRLHPLSFICRFPFHLLRPVN